MHLDDEPRIYTGEPDERVCECLSVERQVLEATIAQLPTLTVSAVRRECRAGGGCGTCHEEIARLLLSRLFNQEVIFPVLDHAHYTHSTHNSGNRVSSEEVNKLLTEEINPRLVSLGIAVQMIENNEEIVLEIPDANAELKYTLGFWIDYEFIRRFPQGVTVILL